MFNKIVAIEPLGMGDSFRCKLNQLGREVVLYSDMPEDQAEVARRMQGADCVLVSFHTNIGGPAIENTPGLKYIGMCCSLYGPESANVDILTAQRLGITVTGVNDYGDNGVPEFVISELVRLLHGFGEHQWKAREQELFGQNAGILGLGTTGELVAAALRHFGANVFYHSRTRKPQTEDALGLRYLPLDDLLQSVDILCCCLNKNVVLLGHRQLELFGSGKVLVNISISPAHDVAALKSWLKLPGSYIIGDSAASIDPSGGLLGLQNVICPKKTAGLTQQTSIRLEEKALENIKTFLSAHK